jgi:hypothetical protein
MNFSKCKHLNHARDESRRAETCLDCGAFKPDSSDEWSPPATKTIFDCDCKTFDLHADSGILQCVKCKKTKLLKDTSKANQTGSENFNASGSKYLRKMRHLIDGRADVYAVLVAFEVTCPARQHAIKKLLCSGIRGKGDAVQDLSEAKDAIDRAIQIEKVQAT